MKYISISRFFIGVPGVIKDIQGTDIFDNNKNILKWLITCEKGQTIQNVKSSWERLGLFFMFDSSYDELEEKVKKVMDSVYFQIE